MCLKTVYENELVDLFSSVESQINIKVLRLQYVMHYFCLGPKATLRRMQITSSSFYSAVMVKRK